MKKECGELSTVAVMSAYEWVFEWNECGKCNECDECNEIIRCGQV